MESVIVLYALALGLAATLLAWLEYRYIARAFSFEIYLLLVAGGAAVLGAWLGNRLTPRGTDPGPFERNAAAVRSLGLSPRELDILDRLAAGESNKEIARALDLQEVTVKLHVRNLCRKLDTKNRTQIAVRLAQLGQFT